VRLGCFILIQVNYKPGNHHYLPPNCGRLKVIFMTNYGCSNHKQIFTELITGSTVEPVFLGFHCLQTTSLGLFQDFPGFCEL